jgi:carbon monoxide dehydrogenase subunit G
MKLEHSFEVAAPIDRVWAALNDLERLAPCLPGAAITARDEDGTYHGTFQVNLGSTTASYRGTIEVESADEGTRTATLKARGADERGEGDASATIVNTLSEHDGATTVHVTVSGPSMMQDISDRLLRDFSTCLQSRVADAPTAPTGEEVTRGEAPPEAVAAAAPEGEMDAEAAAASAGATTAGTTARPAPPPAQPVAAKPVGGLFFSALRKRVSRQFGRSRPR